MNSQNSPTCDALLALGANLGDRAASIRKAIEELEQSPGIERKAVSSLHETEPVGRLDQPRFLNAAMRIDTTLSPDELLQRCLHVERRLGRDRLTGERWGPRIIDIDVLLFGEHQIRMPHLTIPHPRMHERAFALRPATEIAGEMLHPGLNLTVCELLKRLEADIACQASLMDPLDR